MLYIDKNQIEQNLLCLQQKTNACICAVVKCNGYGLGLAPYAQLLQELGITFFAAADPAEAMQLRGIGIRGDILLLSPTYEPETIRTLAAQNIALQIGSLEQLEAMEWALVGTGLKTGVHLALETGFGRWGFSIAELHKYRAQLRHLPVLGSYSHLSSPWKNPSFTHLQALRFENACRTLREIGVDPGLKHLCASGGFLKYPALHMDMVRLGSAIPGCVPQAAFYGLSRAVCLSAPLLQVKTMRRGQSLGYAPRHILLCDTLVGSVAIGKYDGLSLPRNPLKTAFASLEGQPVPILGQPGMNHTFLDLTDIPDSFPGQMVTMPVNPLLSHSERCWKR